MNKIHNKILNFDHTLQIIHAHHASGQRYSKVDKGADGARLTLALKAHGRQTEGYEWPKINYSLSTKLRNIVNEIRFIRTYIFTSGHLVLHFFFISTSLYHGCPSPLPSQCKNIGTQTYVKARSLYRKSIHSHRGYVTSFSCPNATHLLGG